MSENDGPHRSTTGAQTGRENGASRWTRVGADIAAGARTAAPVIKRVGTRVGDWLARIGWGKFILLSILLLILGSLASEALLQSSPVVVVERGSPRDRVQVEVSVTADGVRIAAPAKPARAPVPPKPPAPPAAPTTPSVPDSPQGSAPEVQNDAAPGVRVHDKGVQIVTQKDGKSVAITIDGSGIRIAEPGARSMPAPATAARDGRAVVLSRDVLDDPEKLSESIEVARASIEKIVGDQVARQVARSTRVYQEQTSGWLKSFVLMLILTGIIVKIVLGSKRKAEVRAQAATATAAEEGLKRQLAEAQLKMMQAQVEPHFLFNTLASVDFLIETDPARASTMQKNLIQYLRAALPQMREGSTTLGKEIALCRSYLEILKVRMEDRLQFAITVPRGLATAQFPPMMLQSLVENAIKHGLEPKAEGGSLTINADIAHGVLRVRVADTGLGFGAGGTAGTGVGLANVRERLAALYGGRAKLIVEANTPSGTISTIEVPYEVDLARSGPEDPVQEPAVA